MLNMYITEWQVSVCRIVNVSFWTSFQWPSLSQNDKSTLCVLYLWLDKGVMEKMTRTCSVAAGAVFMMSWKAIPWHSIPFTILIKQWQLPNKCTMVKVQSPSIKLKSACRLKISPLLWTFTAGFQDRGTEWDREIIGCVHNLENLLNDAG